MAHEVRHEEGGAQLGYYVVCLLDILGQKERLKEWARLPPDGQVNESLIQALKETVGKVLSYRDFFEQFFSQFGKDPEPTPAFAGLSEAHRKKFLRVRDCEVSTQQFSDTFLFYSPVINRYGDISGAALHRTLTAAAATLLVGLAAKAPIRGAITVGAGMEIESGNFYGPALAEAHQLESEIAQYPRVVLSQAADEFAHRTSDFSHDEEIELVSAAYQEQHIMTLLTEDTDQQVIVDFMGREVHSTVSHEPEMVKAASGAYRFVRAEARRFATEGDEKHAERYGRLLEYMESRLPIWASASKGSEVGC